MKKIMMSLALIICAYVQPVLAQQTDLSLKFNKALTAYYTLKNALATDKTAEAGKLALVLGQAVNAVPHTGFSSDQQHKLWMQEAGTVKEHTAQLSAAKDLKTQRKNFEAISKSFITLTEELKMNTSTAYLQYCPMGKFSWLNEVKAIQNPYYGSEMYDCGSIKGTITKK